MRKHSDWHRTKGFPVQSLFMAGLVIGIVLPDIIWRMEWHQQTLSTMYLLRTFAAGSEDQTEYLLQVVKMRGSVYLLGMGCGISVFGVPFAVAGSIYLGMKLGLTSDNVCSAVWPAGRTGRSRTVISAVSVLYSICFLSL